MCVCVCVGGGGGRRGVKGSPQGVVSWQRRHDLPHWAVLELNTKRGETVERFE